MSEDGNRKSCRFYVAPIIWHIFYCIHCQYYRSLKWQHLHARCPFTSKGVLHTVACKGEVSLERGTFTGFRYTIACSQTALFSRQSQSSAWQKVKNRGGFIDRQRLLSPVQGGKGRGRSSLCTDVPSPSGKIGRGDVCESPTIIVFPFPRNVGDSLSLVVTLMPWRK